MRPGRKRLARIAGEEIWRDWIGTARAEPLATSVQVATVGELVVGFCHAKALPDKHFTWWYGIAVVGEHEGQGIGQRLEAARQRWAIAAGRSIIVRVDEANGNSKGFFLGQGFRPLSVSNGAPDLPSRHLVMKLPYEELLQRHS